MKATTVSMLVVLVLMMVIPMWFLGPGVFTGRFGSDNSESLEDLRKKAPQGIQEVVTDEEVEIYKWKDEHGVTQFSESSPADGGEAERIVLTPDRNVVDALKIPEENDKQANKPKIISLGSPYSPAGMKDMINDSLQLQEQVTQQQAEQEKMMEQMLNQK